MREADDILRRRPGLGAFARQAEDLRAELAHADGPAALGASALTAAELRLLPLLATHLSFPEIAAEMFLSRNTVKSHINSIYRKLGTSSRSQAVSRLRDARAPRSVRGLLSLPSRRGWPGDRPRDQGTLARARVAKVPAWAD